MERNDWYKVIKVRTEKLFKAPVKRGPKRTEADGEENQKFKTSTNKNLNRMILTPMVKSQGRRDHRKSAEIDWKRVVIKIDYFSVSFFTA